MDKVSCGGQMRIPPPASPELLEDVGINPFFSQREGSHHQETPKKDEEETDTVGDDISLAMHLHNDKLQSSSTCSGHSNGQAAALDTVPRLFQLLKMPESLGITRKHSTSTLGKEGEYILPKSHTGKRIAVFTSGGDSQGMNAAVRAVVRMGLYVGCRMFFIKEGYQGMVDGGEQIVEADSQSVSDIIQRGGTVIGSARCKQFITRDGRLKACENLIRNGIGNLVCIGGDGSLTGANRFRQEWLSLVEELVATKRIAPDSVKDNKHINIVGLVGSIDNDFCGTDMTIGTDTALHRIIEAVDCVTSTAASHQRAFVIEVMGRHCGYLALVAAMATEADWLFIPEWPQNADWELQMCDKLSKLRPRGQRVNIVIVSEGAVDHDGNHIKADSVRDVIVKRLGFDTRVTVLGHVQRGGRPSAFDRLLGCRMGAEAVLTLVEMTEDSAAFVISIDGNQMVRVPLITCVEATKAVQSAMLEKDWPRVCALRGRGFERNLNTYKLFNTLQPRIKVQDPEFNLAVVNIGSPACGMNAAVRGIVRVALYNNCRVYGIQNCLSGLMNGEFKELKWEDVIGWTMHGGSFLGTQKQIPKDEGIEAIARNLGKFQIHGLLLIGGFEAYHSALILTENRDKFPQLCIPMVVIPATISNNVPGTSLSLGSDTALNEICSLIDKIKQSASGTKKRVFIIETMGGYCGYLATLSALASGADQAYIFEQKFNVNDMKNDVKVIASKMETKASRYVVIRNENACENYTTQFMLQLFSEEGRGQFSTRINVLGHAQQGGSPTPFDRNMSTKFATKAFDQLFNQMRANRKENGTVYTRAEDTGTLLGLQNQYLVFTPLPSLRKQTDFKHRLPVDQWWMRIRPLLRILTQHYEADYKPSLVDITSPMMRNGAIPSGIKTSR